MKISHLSRIFFPKVNSLVIMLLVMGHLLSEVRFVSAQTNDGLSDPINLSQSGAAGNPLLITDSTDGLHVIWQDRFDGWMVASFKDGDWITAQAVGFPFQNFSPQLYVDEKRNIHAFWQDDQNVLYHSKIIEDEFGISAGWNIPVILANSALDLDFQEDAAGNLHVAYVRAIDANGFAAGIYFRTSLDGGNNWNQAVNISTSEYFRSLSKEQANVKIETIGRGDSSKIFVAWDNRPRKRVYIAQSGDGGINWEEPREIDRPNSEQGISEPFNINITSLGNNVLLVWQNGVSGSLCDQSYQFSSDLGVTWSKRQSLLEGNSVCSDQISFLNPVNNLILMPLINRNQLYLLAWDGKTWSELQPQPSLTTFLDPSTLLPISMACIQMQIIEPNRLFAVGCENGETKDVWVVNTLLDDTGSWFPTPTTWEKLSRLVSNQSEISSPTLITGSAGQMHAFWMQADGSASSLASDTRKTIFYSNWNGARWSNPIEILRSKIDVYQFAATFDPAGRLLIVWNDNRSGETYFNWANESDAGNPLEWNLPLVLPILSSPISKLKLASDGAGRIYVVFSIPLNEGRGIYITNSGDLGQTWAEPTQIFDGVAAKWPMISDLSFALSKEGTLHVTWERAALPGSTGEEGLYYSRSDDFGSNWVGIYELTKAPVIWSQIIDIQGSQLLCLWQEVNSGNKELWYQISLDKGMSWESLKSFPSFSQNQVQGLVSLTQDSNEMPHAVIQTIMDESKDEIWHWVWDGTGWRSDQHKLRLGPDDAARINGLSAIVSMTGELGVLFSGPVSEKQEELKDEVLIFSSHPVADLSIPLNIPTPQSSETNLSQSQPMPSQVPESTPVEISSGSQANPGRDLPIDRTIMGIVIGAGVAGFIIVVAISLTMIPLRKQQRREYSDEA